MITTLAHDIALILHSGQYRRSGEDYIVHPEHVAASCNSIAEKTVAYLHDTIEDTPITAHNLRRLFPRSIVDAVVAISKKPTESYFSYILRLAKNPIARNVKIKDIEDNFPDCKIRNLIPYSLVWIILFKKII